MDHGCSHKRLALIHDGTLPSSPSSMCSPQTKPSGYLKAGMGQPSSRKQIMGGLTATDSTREGISSLDEEHQLYCSLSVYLTLQLVSQADSKIHFEWGHQRHGSGDAELYLNPWHRRAPCSLLDDGKPPIPGETHGIASFIVTCF